MKLPSMKRGDTFSFCASFKDSDGNLVVADPSAIRSQLRNAKDQLVADLIVENTGTLGVYTLRYDGSTEQWAMGTLYFDIEVMQSGVKTSSETLEIQIVKDVTKS